MTDADTKRKTLRARIQMHDWLCWACGESAGGKLTPWIGMEIQTRTCPICQTKDVRLFRRKEFKFEETT